MAKDKILTVENDRRANAKAATVLLVWACVIQLVWVLNVLGIFVIDSNIMGIAAIGCGALYCIPFIMVCLLRMNEPSMKYLILGACAAGSGFLYVLLNYHVILMFAFPVVMSLLYFDRTPVIFASAATLCALIASHIINIFCCFIPDAPLTTTSSILLYGLLPRGIVFLAFSVLCLTIMEACHDLLEKVFSYSGEIARNKTGLSRIISVSQKLFGSRTVVDVTAITTATVYEVVKSVQADAEPPVSRVAIRTDDGKYHRIDEEMRDGIDIIRNDSIEFTVGEKPFSIPIHRQKVQDNVSLSSDGIIMTFYDDDNRLVSYAVINMNIDTSDKLIASLLEILHNNISIAITNAKLNSDMFKTQEEIILAFAEISESKSKQTGQHVKRVAEYAKLMGERLGMSGLKCSELYLAAMLHDIGKLLIPAEILEKPGKLTREEFEVIKTHVTIGEQLLRNSPGEVMHMARAIALQHHEKWDGTGYLGLIGDQINYESRILAICDVFDALVSRRSYKAGWPPEKAYEEILSSSGTHFDPSLVNTFVESYDGFLDILYRYPDTQDEFAAV